MGECNKNCHEMTPKELLQLAQGGRERGEEKERRRECNWWYKIRTHKNVKIIPSEFPKK